MVEFYFILSQAQPNICSGLDPPQSIICHFWPGLLNYIFVEALNYTPVAGAGAGVHVG
jgi:hypothetical protein